MACVSSRKHHQRVSGDGWKGRQNLMWIRELEMKDDLGA